MKKFDGLVLAVAHKEFLDMNLKDFKKDDGIIYDLKSVIKNQADYFL